MQSDLGILELAAKAAGMKLGQYADGWHWVNDGPRGAGIYKIDPNQSPVGNPRFRFLYWNPLTDDGDALRLAVKLRLDIAFVGTTLVEVCWFDQSAFTTRFAEESINDAQGEREATRRAIVRAAAEIGAQAHPDNKDGGGHE